MKQLLSQFAVYNTWANERLSNAIAQLSANLIDKPLDSSFNSIRLTTLHLWEVELMWWQRLHAMQNVPSSPKNKDLPINAILNSWKKQSLEWQEWIVNESEEDLQKIVVYKNSRNEEFRQPVFQVVLHVFNHATYHRGQLVTMFHQLKVSEIPNTDFINWSRSIESKSQ